MQQVPALQRALHHQLDLVRLERLGNVIEGAELHRLDRGVDLRQTGDHDHVDVGMAFLDQAQHFEAADIRHHDVEDHHVVGVFLDFAQRLAAVLHRLDPIVVAVEDAQAAADDDLLVVDDQNSRAHETPPLALLNDAAAGGASGSKMRNVDPSPTLLSTSMRPPWASTIP